VSLIVFIILLVKGGENAGDAGYPEQKPGRRPLPQPYQMVAQWSLLAVIMLLGLGSVFVIAGAKDLSQQQAYGRERLLNLAANPRADIDYYGLSAIYPRPKVIVERYPVLVKHRLSVFRDREIPLDSP
jgi:hypothetical protein